MIILGTLAHLLAHPLAKRHEVVIDTGGRDMHHARHANDVVLRLSHRRRHRRQLIGVEVRRTRRDQITMERLRPRHNNAPVSPSIHWWVQEFCHGFVNSRLLATYSGAAAAAHGMGDMRGSERGRKGGCEGGQGGGRRGTPRGPPGCQRCVRVVQSTR
eukprot:1175869-Prorocentrum_minimum.AAC.1